MAATAAALLSQGECFAASKSHKGTRPGGTCASHLRAGWGGGAQAMVVHPGSCQAECPSSLRRTHQSLVLRAAARNSFRPVWRHMRAKPATAQAWPRAHVLLAASPCCV